MNPPVPAAELSMPATVAAWWLEIEGDFAGDGIDVNEHDPDFQRSMFYMGFNCALLTGFKLSGDVAEGRITRLQSKEAIQDLLAEITAYLDMKAGKRLS